MLSPPGPFGDKLRTLGLRWMPVSMERRSLNPFREFNLVLLLSRLMSRERVDLFHGFTIKSAVYGALAARLAGVPARICSIDGLGYVFASDNLKAKFLRPLVWFMLLLALNGKNTRLILLNRDDVTFFQVARLINSNYVRLIPGAGVDCKRFMLGGKRIAGNPLRVLLSARLLWDKGLEEFAAAARLLKDQGRHVHFLLAGMPDPGNPKSVPEANVQNWVDEGLIDWLGHVFDMPALLATVHVVVLPSYREGLPTALTEAAACSLPIITTNVPGCRDVVTHGVDGLLIPVRDSEALAEAIICLDDDQVLAASLGAAARAKTLKVFEEQIVIRSTLEIYAEFIK
jgi:glycosyltransferase involved in cell wall biosynthesis